MTQLGILARADSEARRAAITQFGAPLALEAGAGTGKTAVLVARVLFWSLGPGFERSSGELGGQADDEAVAARVLERVTAITFTDRAAAEMAERIAEALGQLARGAPVIGFPLDDLRGQGLDDAAIARRARALLAGIDRASVGTIHAFCRRLLAAYPIEAGVHPAFEVDADGSAVRRIVEEVISDKLADAYGDPGDPDFVSLAAQGFGPSALANALEVLADQSLPLEAVNVDPYAADLVREAGERFACTLDALAAGLRRAVGPQQSLEELPRVRQALVAISELAGRARAAHSASELSDIAAADEVDRLLERMQRWLRGDFGREQPHDPARFEATREHYVALRRAATNLRAIDEQRMPLAARTLRPLLAEVYRRMRAEGVMTFSGLLSGARDLLRGSPNVLHTVRRGIEQLLVDEFQDTDPLQCEVIGLIALRDGAEPHDSAPAAPGLMVVGDPKQSIYGWRNADLAAYEAFVARVMVAGGERRALVVNFRSVAPILDEVQRIIEPVMREQSGVQPAFQQLLPAPTPAAGRKPFRAGERRSVEHWVCWATPPTDEAAERAETARAAPRTLGPRTQAEQARRIEARALAHDLLTLHQRHGMPWRHAAILLRTTTAQDTYLQALREAQIPFVVERDRSYYRRREIVDAAALTRSIVDPNDQVALVAFLRSPYVGVPDAALLPLWREGLPELLARMMPRRAAAADSAAPELGLIDGELIEQALAAVDAAAAATPAAPGIERVPAWPLSAKAGVRALARLRASFVAEPVDRFVERIRELLLVEESSATRYLGAHRLANLERFFRRLLAGLAGGDRGGVHGVLRELRSGVAEARAEEEAAAYDETLDAVRVLTIHKSKGLTFEHVYVVGMHGEPGRGRPRPETEADVVTRDDSGAARWSLRLLGVPDLSYDELEARRARVASAEAVRTLYVAATRPRVRLVLSGRRPADGAEPRTVQAAMSHIDLLEHRRGKRPALEPLLAARTPSRVGSDGVRWLLPDRLKAPRVAEPQRRAPVVTLQDATAEVERLVLDRAAATVRMARPMTRAASARSHETLREQVEAAGEGGRSGQSLNAELAPYVGTAVHRVLEMFDVGAELSAECARQRELLPGYLLELEPQRRAVALERCQQWLERLESSQLLRRLVGLGGRIVAREAPLLLAPAGDPSADDEAVGATVGTVDLLYKDEAGELVVADYKTDGVESEQAIAERAAVYGEQGRVYVDAIERGLGVARPRFELWFLHADVVRAVDI